MHSGFLLEVSKLPRLYLPNHSRRFRRPTIELKVQTCGDGNIMAQHNDSLMLKIHRVHRELEERVKQHVASRIFCKFITASGRTATAKCIRIQNFGGIDVVSPEEPAAEVAQEHNGETLPFEDSNVCCSDDWVLLYPLPSDVRIMQTDELKECVTESEPAAEAQPNDILSKNLSERMEMDNSLYSNVDNLHQVTPNAQEAEAAAAEAKPNDTPSNNNLFVRSKMDITLRSNGNLHQVVMPNVQEAEAAAAEAQPNDTLSNNLLERSEMDNSLHSNDILHQMPPKPQEAEVAAAEAQPNDTLSDNLLERIEIHSNAILQGMPIAQNADAAAGCASSPVSESREDSTFWLRQDAVDAACNLLGVVGIVVLYRYCESWRFPI